MTISISTAQFLAWGLPIISTPLGHLNPKTIERYTFLGVDPTRRAADEISAQIEGYG
jgi:hypothetical protein